MKVGFRSKSFWALCFALLMATSATAQVKLAAKFNSAYGWVKPGETYPFFLEYSAGVAGASSVSIQVTLPPSATYVGANPAPASGNGGPASPLTWNLGVLAPNSSGRILVRARAASLTEDPEIVRHFAQFVGVEERLKMLCLMTLADVEAVSREEMPSD